MLVDCCLDERAWNPYYALLALRLCGGGGGGGPGEGGGGSLGRAHRVTLQYCLWDKFKELEVGWSWWGLTEHKGEPGAVCKAWCKTRHRSVPVRPCQ